MIKVGSARIDEKGNAHGGKAGDQTGNEVKTQNWYPHNWVVLRPNDPIDAEQMAYAMERACANDLIGYDQYQRDTLYAESKKYGFDPGKVVIQVETDCSALVRVCCAYAGIDVPNNPRFCTTIEPKVLVATGKFTLITDPAYTDHYEHLRRGDVLCTKTTGHTVIVLGDGPLSKPVTSSMIGPIDVNHVKTISLMDKGIEVEYLQYLLATKFGYKLPKSVDKTHQYGYDGEWGDETEAAFEDFQRKHKDLDGRPLKVDTDCGPKSWGAMLGVPCK